MAQIKLIETFVRYIEHHNKMEKTVVDTYMITNNNGETHYISDLSPHELLVNLITDLDGPSAIITAGIFLSKF